MDKTLFLCVNGSRLITKLIFRLRIELRVRSAESHISWPLFAVFATQVGEWSRPDRVMANGGEVGWRWQRSAHGQQTTASAGIAVRH